MVSGKLTNFTYKRTANTGAMTTVPLLASKNKRSKKCDNAASSVLVFWVEAHYMYLVESRLMPLKFYVEFNFWV